MTHISYSELRQNLARYLDETVASRAPIVVTRQGGKEPVEGLEPTSEPAELKPAAAKGKRGKRKEG